MYTPKHFEINDKNEVLSYLKENAFAQLTSIVAGKLFASHIPFLVNSDASRLLGHLAKANPQWQDIEDQEVLITFQGPHDYISPSWYRAPGVPTWNYQAVHIYGKCKVINEPEELRSIVNELTHTYESNFPQPWAIQYSDAKLRGIVGIEVVVSDIQCKYKLSQNRSEQEREEVTRQLDLKGSPQLASAMKNKE